MARNCLKHVQTYFLVEEGLNLQNLSNTIQYLIYIISQDYKLCEFFYELCITITVPFN